VIILDGWSEEEIFFDDEDMSTEEMMWNVFLWYGEALNPVGFIMDPQAKFTPRGVVQSGVVAGALWSAAAIVGGPLSSMSGQGPTFSRMLALKGDALAKKAKYVVRSTPAVVRGVGYAFGFTALYLTLQAGISEVHDIIGGPIQIPFYVDLYQGP